MAYCLPPGNDISAVELVRLANEHGMNFNSASGSPRISHVKRASGTGVFTGIVGSAPYPRESNGVASVSRYHGISEWTLNNDTVSMLILAHCWGTYIPAVREVGNVMGDPRFAVGLGIYYGSTQVSGAYDLGYVGGIGGNYAWDIGQHNDYFDETPGLDGYHSQYFVSYVDNYALGPSDSEIIYARFRVAPASENYIMDESLSEFHVALSVLYVVQT